MTDFSPAALVVFVAFCVLMMVALSADSAAVHIAEAVVTVIILMGAGGFALRNGRRSR